MEVYDMTCEYQKEALGVGTSRPVFGWKLRSSRNGEYQTAYQIVISDPRSHVLYDSGKVYSDAQTGVETDLSGRIEPFTKYRVRVRAWDRDDTAGNDTESYFVTGIFKAYQWVGTWFDATWGHFGEAAFFRREFDIRPEEIEYAYLYLGSIGEKANAAAIYLNGERVGNLPNFPGLQKPSTLFTLVWTFRK